VISSGDGKVIEWDADYYPYGNLRLVTNKLTNYYQYTGYEHDYSTGYNYGVSRFESSNIGRFLSPDPVGGNLTDPQSWNAYGYVGNRSTVYIDTLGLGPEGCNSSICDVPPISIIADLLGLLGLFGGHHPAYHPNGPPPGHSGAGQNSGVWSEQLPNGVTLKPPSLTSIILPVDTGCDFGACVPIGDPFGPGLVLAGIGTTICQIAEPCGVIEDLVFAGAVIIGAADIIHEMAKGGDQNQADTGIEAEAQEMVRQKIAKDMCGALQQLWDSAAGDSVRRGRIKKTQKAYDCRRHG